MKYFLMALLFITGFMCPIEVYAASDCLNAGCHARLLESKYVHGPVAVGDCASCHTQTGKHTFRLSAEGAGLCVSCHDIRVKSNCGSCHDPHGSTREFQLKPGVSGNCKK